MQIVVVASRKGGVGKTTLSAHLALAAIQASKKQVALLDLDPQGSLSWWAQQRQDSPLHVSTCFPEQLNKQLTELKKAGVEILIVDTPPTSSPWLEKLIVRANLVVVPTRASSLDIHAVGATFLSVANAQTPMVWVLNGVSSRSKLADAVAVELKKFAPLAPQVLHERIDFAMAIGQGQTVLESKPNGASAKEIKAVWKFIQQKLNQGQK